MDAEFKHYLDEALTTMARHILHEMNIRFAEVNTRFDSMDSRFDSMDARLKLQAGLLQSGARAITRLSEHAESSESRYIELLTKYNNLESRIARLEAPPRPGPATH